MPSITSWSRLEPRARSGDMRPSLEARIADPLWMLGRQWQVAEFHGDDAGSPVAVRVRAESVAVSRYRAGDAAPVAYAPDRPLERVVEREPGQGVDRRRAAEGGAQFLRRVAARGLAKHAGLFLSACPLDPAGVDEADAGTRRYLSLMAGRVPDGGKLVPYLRGNPALGIPQAEQDTIMAVARDWLAWFADDTGGGDAWQPDRMEHRFALAARGAGAEVVLSAEEYRGGRLDWDAFDSGGASLSAPTSSPRSLTRTTLAAPARYPGMPAPRWWQFEDARVDFGGVEAGPEDLARMLVVEYASLYSNDWHLVPIEIPVGSLAEIRSLVVLDTFGERTLIGPADEPGSWSLFRIAPSGGGPTLPRLFLAPALADGLESEPLEEVLLLRDELANMAWGVERLVEAPTGRPRQRAEEAATRDLPLPAVAAREPDPAVPLAYRLLTTVPEHWMPFVPEEVTPGVNRLVRSAMERAQLGELVPIPPAGRLLAGPSLSLFEEEVPREGARLTRTRQQARWTDGSTHRWTARRKSVGRGEGSSGLAFDLVEPAAAEPVELDAQFVDAMAWRDASLREPADLRALRPGERVWVVVTVRNLGTAAWRRGGALPIALATLLPPDHASALATSEWESPSRPALVSEAEVEPGAVGTFEFPLVAPLAPGPVAEHLNLVAGRQRWFPGSAAFVLHAGVRAGVVATAGWESLGGAVAGAPAVSVLPDGTLAVFATHADGSVRRLDVSPAGPSPAAGGGAAGSSGGTTGSSGGATESSPAAAGGTTGSSGGATESSPAAAGGTWTSLGGAAASSPVVAGTDVYVRGADGTLQRFADGAWTSLGGTPAAAPVVAGTTVFAVFADGTVQRFADGRWTSLGGRASHTPALARGRDGRLELYARAADGTLHTSDGSGTWTPLGGALAGPPAVADLADGRRVVLALHGDGSVRMLLGGQWSSLGGAAASSPVLARHADGRLEAFVRFTDGTVRAAREAAGTFGPWESLGGQSAAAPVPAALADGRLAVFAAHPDGSLRMRRQAAAGGPWAHTVAPWAKAEGLVLGVHAELGVDTVLTP